MFWQQSPWVVGLLSLAATSSGHGAESLTITEANDATIMSTEGANPRGDQTILVGTRGTLAQGTFDRGLLRFNLSELPTNAVIQSVTLQLTVVQIPQNPIASVFNLHRLLTRWDDTANWANARAGTPWSAPGGKEAVDYAAEISAGQEVDEEDSYDFGPTDQLRGDLQNWLGNPTANNGWLLMTDSEGTFFTARHFGSSKSDNPPQLLIEYSTGTSEGPTMRDPRATNNIFTFTFSPTPGEAYSVESRTNLNLGSWTVATNIPASTTTNSLAVTNAMSASGEFFRLRVQ